MKKDPLPKVHGKVPRGSPIWEWSPDCMSFFIGCWHLEKQPSYPSPLSSFRIPSLINEFPMVKMLPEVVKYVFLHQILKMNIFCDLMLLETSAPAWHSPSGQ